MKILKSILIVILVTLISSFTYAEKVAAVFKIVGQVQVKPLSERKFVPAYVGQMLESGDWIQTSPASSIAILMLDKSMLKIRENSEMEIRSKRVDAKTQSTDLFLAQGEVWTKVQKQRGEFQIATPTSVASVKGTEFFLEHDQEENLTSLYVVEGVVEFTNELGKVLAQEMTYSISEQDKAPEPAQKMTKSMLPTWQKEVEPSWGFRMTPEKTGRQPVNTVLKVGISAFDTKQSKNAYDYTGTVAIESEEEFMLLSKDGSVWRSSLSLPLQNGKANFQVKALKPGNFALVASADNAEARRLQLEFYRSQSQMKNLQTKLQSLAGKKGMEEVQDKLEGAEIQSASVAQGQGSVEDIMHKVEIGEYEVQGVQEIENPDGSTTLQLIIIPATIGGNE